MFKGPTQWGTFLIETTTVMVMVNQFEASLSDSRPCLTQATLSEHPQLVGGQEIRPVGLPWLSQDFFSFILTVCIAGYPSGKTHPE